MGVVRVPVAEVMVGTVGPSAPAQSSVASLRPATAAGCLSLDELAGVDPQRAREQEWRRGVLPPGRLGWRMLGDLVDRAVPLARAALERRTTSPTAVDIDVDLGDGRWLRGTVPGVFGNRLVPVSYSRLGATHRLQSWLSVLALSAADPDRNWTAHTIGRTTNARSRDGFAVSVLGPVDDYAARDVLGQDQLGAVTPLQRQGVVPECALTLRTQRGGEAGTAAGHFVGGENVLGLCHLFAGAVHVAGFQPPRGDGGVVAWRGEAGDGVELVVVAHCLLPLTLPGCLKQFDAPRRVDVT